VQVAIVDTGGSELSASFEAVWSEPHYVALVFRPSPGQPRTGRADGSGAQ
jgi:hypothetical protein